jgi:hypothetical protein
VGGNDSRNFPRRDIAVSLLQHLAATAPRVLAARSTDAGAVGHSGNPVELHDQVAVGGDDERGVQAFAGAVHLGLLQPVRGREMFRSWLPERRRLPAEYRCGPLRAGCNRLCLAARLIVDDLDRAGSLFALDQILSPPALV